MGDRRVQTEIIENDEDEGFDLEFENMGEDKNEKPEVGGDLNNYKGIFFNDDPSSKYQDPETGAHFSFKDICTRLRTLQGDQ